MLSASLKSSQPLNRVPPILNSLVLRYHHIEVIIPATTDATRLSQLMQVLFMKMFVDVNVIYLHRDPVDFRIAINGRC